MREFFPPTIIIIIIIIERRSSAAIRRPVDTYLFTAGTSDFNRNINSYDGIERFRYQRSVIHGRFLSHRPGTLNLSLPPNEHCETLLLPTCN